MQFAILNASKHVSNADLAFMTEACNQQSFECADAWSVARMPVAFYSTVDGLPIDRVWTVVVVDDLDDPGALGYHTAILGTPFGRVLAQDVAGTCTTLSHEVLETLIDPSAEGWWDRGNGTKVAAEVCDPVEASWYWQTATIGETTLSMPVSNYLLPAWRNLNVPAPDLPAPTYDRMGLLKSPWEMAHGGYQVVEDAKGNDSTVFARRRVIHAGSRGALNAGRKLARPDSRLLRRLQAA